jgi:magnesium-protoporphyrin IX monomethyl ester (oxidative) cyclase
MYLNDLQRSDFYSTIGLDAKQFDIHVIRKTNQSSGTLFPIILDLDNPKFFNYLENCASANQALIDIEKEESLEALKVFAKIPQYTKMISNLIGLYLLPAIETKYVWTEES